MVKERPPDVQQYGPLLLGPVVKPTQSIPQTFQSHAHTTHADSQVTGNRYIYFFHTIDTSKYPPLSGTLACPGVWARGYTRVMTRGYKWLKRGETPSRYPPVQPGLYPITEDIEPVCALKWDEA